jgi:hypothetical protein
MPNKGKLWKNQSSSYHGEFSKSILRNLSLVLPSSSPTDSLTSHQSQLFMMVHNKPVSATSQKLSRLVTSIAELLDRIRMRICCLKRSFHQQLLNWSNLEEFIEEFFSAFKSVV